MNIEKRINSYEEERKEQEKISAKVELTQAKAMKVLLSNNDLAAEIHISGMKMGVCNTKLLLPIIENQIKEIGKFLKGQKNDWQ